MWAIGLVLLVVLVVLVLVGVRHLGDVRRRRMTYAVAAAGLVGSGPPRGAY